jgi:DNA-binding response OmpR family regulator
MTILLVERDAQLRAGYAYCLRAEGWRVVQAESVGLPHLRDKQYQVIVIDAQVLHHSGRPLWDVVAESASCPVLVLALSPEHERQLRRTQHSNVAYLVKPFSLRLLVHMIGQLSVQLEVA